MAGGEGTTAEGHRNLGSSYQAISSSLWMALPSPAWGAPPALMHSPFCG